MKVAIFCHNYVPHPGGLEAIVEHLARGIQQAHTVRLITTEWGGRTGISIEGGIEVHRLRAIHAAEAVGVPLPVPSDPYQARAARDAAAACDIVHVHGALYPTTLLGISAARCGRRPLVLTEHVGFVDYANPLLNVVEDAAWRTIGDRSLRAADHIVAYNGRVVEWLGQRSGRLVEFVPNGVDCHEFRPRPAEKAEIREKLKLPSDLPLGLFVGRDTSKKRLPDLLGSGRRSYHLVVCGARRELTDSTITDLGIVPRNRMPEVFAACDFLIHPASGEGFPLAVQEAMASGLPVVIRWDEGYERSLDRNAVIACLDREALVRATEVLAADHDLRERYSRIGREWAREKWDWTVTVDRHVEIYAALLESSRRL